MAQKEALMVTDDTENNSNLTHKKRYVKYRPEYCDMLIEEMASGFTFDSFASDIGVSKQTLYNWCLIYPEFKEAKDIGIEASRKTLEGIMLNVARTGKGNFIPAFIMLKNRFPNDWRDKQEIEVAKESETKLTLDEQIQKVELMREQLLRLKAGEDTKIVEI